MNSSRDTDGHGTATSSIAAGNYVDDASYFGYAAGTARGVAPRARVAIYKVLWDQGCTDSDLLAAIDQAIMDGVDILSLSIGRGWIPLFSHTLAIASFAAMEKGIFVAASAGNNGDGLYTVGNEAPWTLTVAASTVDRSFEGVIDLGNMVHLSGSSLYSGNSVSGELVYLMLCENQTELEQSANKIVVCDDRGEDPGEFPLENSTAAGYIFIRNNPDVIFLMRTTFPTVHIDSDNGQIILDYINASLTEKPTATLGFQETTIGTKPAPMVSSYSSRGPSRGCPFVLKPDLTAPGTLILASGSQYQEPETSKEEKLISPFDIHLGTSMAAPHAAGVAALLKAAHPEWSPAAIRSAMMTTSDVLDNTFSSIKADTYAPASPLAMGAGHINPNKAMDPGLIYDIRPEDYVNLLCGLNFTKEQILAITRSSTYSCPKPTVDINYPSFITSFLNVDGINITKTKEFQRRVTYVGNGKSTFVAKLTPLNGITASVVPNTMVFKDKYEKQSYKLIIKGPSLLTDDVVYGFLSWEETQGKHVVRSPIVVTTLYPPSSVA